MAALIERARPSSVNSRDIQISEFPRDVFEFDDPNKNTYPELKIKDPWNLDIKWIQRGKIPNVSGGQTVIFAEEFNDIPVLTATVLKFSAGLNCFAVIKNLSKTSFDVELINYDGTSHVETDDYIMWIAML